MTNQRPITPPPELRQLWAQEAQRISPHDPVEWMQYVSEKAAQWGADTELEACVDVLSNQREWDMLSQCTGWKEFKNLSEKILRAARRPNPSSLKEQALKELDKVDMLWATEEFGQETLNSLDTIRLAIESIPDPS